MTLTMGLRYKNPDASADINLRLKDVAKKGFVSGGAVTPVSGVLQVSVAPFVCINYDGAVVRSDANVVLNPGDGIVNVVFLRARYVPLGSPVMQVQVAPVTSYLIDPEFDWLTVLAIVDLTVGAPHTAVDPSEIVYSWTNGVDTVERHAVDQQGRGFYREPVANSGDLFTPGSPYLPPLADNRNGDVRLALDTGSFYWWNEAGGLWEVFDEVPLNMHREHEHTNGITGDSASTTLQPSSLASTALIAAVPAGSGYTVNGRYVTAPTPMPFSQNLAGDPKFSNRGLIQASSDQLGVVTLEDSGNGDYRVNLTDPLSIAAARIIDISDAHGLGLFTLRFDPATGLSWADGEPVDVGTGTATGGGYRLYTPDYANWVDVRLTAGDALPGAVTDVYEVFASKKDDEHFLIGYFFWNGTAITDVTDKRYFGNLGTQELADEFKETLKTEWTDLRGNMVYSGGDVSTTITPFVVRVVGPLVAYVNGIRKVVPITFGGQDGYTGLLLTASATSYLYVDSAGVFQVSTTVPTASDATVARVVCSGAAVTLIEDQRDPQIIVGQATRTARLRWTTEDALEWTPANKMLSVKSNGSLAGTDLEVETALVTNVQASALVVSPTVYTGSIQRQSLLAGSLQIGDDANTTAINIGRNLSGQVNQLNGDLWLVPGAIGVDGGIRRVLPGTLSIGNDVNVTDINIGTTGTTGDVTLGSLAGGDVITNGPLLINEGAEVPGARTLLMVSGSSLEIQGGVQFNSASEINANGGISRSTNGVLTIGNDANVTGINIGTSVNTGNVNIGKTGTNAVFGANAVVGSSGQFSKTSGVSGSVHSNFTGSSGSQMLRWSSSSASPGFGVSVRTMVDAVASSVGGNNVDDVLVDIAVPSTNKSFSCFFNIQVAGWAFGYDTSNDNRLGGCVFARGVLVNNGANGLFGVSVNEIFNDNFYINGASGNPSASPNVDTSTTWVNASVVNLGGVDFVRILIKPLTVTLGPETRNTRWVGFVDSTFALEEP